MAIEHCIEKQDIDIINTWLQEMLCSYTYLITTDEKVIERTYSSSLLLFYFDMLALAETILQNDTIDQKSITPTTKKVFSLIKKYPQQNSLLVKKLLCPYAEHPYFKLILKQLALFHRVIGFIDRDPVNRFIKRFKQKAFHSKYQQQLVPFNTLAKKNYTNLAHYTHQLLTHCSDLLLVHITLYPLPTIKQEKASSTSFIDYPYLDQNSIDYTAIRTDRINFFTQLQKHLLGKALIGYAWKINNLPYPGYFYQCLLYFNKALLPDFSKEYFEQTIQKIRRQYNKSFYRVTINTIDPKGLQFMDKLHCTFTKMTQLEQYLKYPTDLKKHRFGRGQLTTKKRNTIKQINTSSYWQPL